MNNQINVVCDVSKIYIVDVESFKFGDFGVLGVVDEDCVVFVCWLMCCQYLFLFGGILLWVEIIFMFGGVSGDLLCVVVMLGVSGIVIQVFGCGNVNVDMYEVIWYVIGQGILVVIFICVFYGCVLLFYGFDGGGVIFKVVGVVFVDDLSLQKVCILLMLVL